MGDYSLFYKGNQKKRTLCLSYSCKALLPQPTDVLRISSRPWERVTGRTEHISLQHQHECRNAEARTPLALWALGAKLGLQLAHPCAKVLVGTAVQTCSNPRTVKYWNYFKGGKASG